MKAVLAIIVASSLCSVVAYNAGIKHQYGLSEPVERRMAAANAEYHVENKRLREELQGVQRLLDGSRMTANGSITTVQETPIRAEATTQAPTIIVPVPVPRYAPQPRTYGGGSSLGNPSASDAARVHNEALMLEELRRIRSNDTLRDLRRQGEQLSH